ncbi:dioxygenase [Pseudomonas chlororaphis subsp. aurantiaca]|nr:dioxygenase [Pseudomonas chlororaphis subsp. aurantiaca]
MNQRILKLKVLMDSNGEGTIYRHCYCTPDIEAAYDELLAAGVQPEDENGPPLSRDNLQSPGGPRILWLPKRFGHFPSNCLKKRSWKPSSRRRSPRTDKATGISAPPCRIG